MKKIVNKTNIFSVIATFAMIAVLGISSTSIAQAASTVVVTQSNMQGWSFVNDQTDGPGNGTLVSGPATPPFIEGSAQLTTSSGSDGQIITKATLAGTKISNITNLSYTTYQNASNSSNATALGLQLNIDKDVTDADNSWQGRMIYEPYLNNGGTVPLGTWNTWDALSSGNGKWWFSKSNPGQAFAASGCTMASPCTLTQIETMYPNIGIHPTLGAVSFKAGSGWTGNFSGNVDSFTVGVSGNDTTYDFDVDDVTAPAVPSPVSPLNNAIVTTTNLTKIDWTDVTDRSSPVTYVYQASNSNSVDGNGDFDISPIYNATTTVSEIPTPGTPEATYYWHVKAIDAKGNASAWSTAQKVTVDNTAPSIAAHADITGVEATSPSGAVVTYTNPTATDNVDGSIATTCILASGSTFALGTTGVICNAVDTAGNTATSTTFNVQVVDTTAPVISIAGANPMTVQAGTVFTDPGATAVDASGDFAASSTNDVNTSVLGTYTVTYTATDSSGNTATSTTRTVNVVDTTAPVAPTAVSPSANSIFNTSSLTTLDWNDVSDFSAPVTYGYQLSTSPVTNPNGSFSFPTASGNLLSTSDAVIASSSIANEGEYYYIARAIDALGNTGDWMAPVHFTIDNTAPVITLTGLSTVTVEGGSVYTDAGATALDTHDGSVTVSTSGTVDTSTVGTYTLTYSAIDAAGNTAAPMTRTVNVVDTTKPVLTVNGVNPVVVEGGSTYTDAGATATDNVAGPLNVVTSGTVDTHVLGTTTLSYDVTDAAGNVAVTATRDVVVVDTTAPVIHINGQNPNIVTLNNAYVDSGATAADLIDGAITVSSSSNVDTSVLGTYTVTYTATDLSGNTATSSRTVTVIPPDTTAPIITILGSNPTTIEAGTTYVDAGATALDNVNGNLTSSIATVNNVQANTVGSYTVTYNVADGAGNHATEGVRAVNVIDTTKPVLTLNGQSVVTLHTGDTYTELGATATDVADPAVLVTIGGDTVSTTATSTFIITYDAVDASGNHANTITRTVNVVDISVPIITLTGSSTVNVEYGSNYVDAGATAADDVDGDISANISTTGFVATTTLGTYTISYNVSDSSGNSANTVTRTVNVVDTTAPVITLNGSSTVALVVGDSYTDAGVTAIDAVDGDISANATTTGSVDTSTVGTYTLTYSVTDNSGNTATSSRTVTVSAAPDTTAPVITLIGSNPVTITVGAVFTDAGATTTDNVDLNVPVTASSTVDVNTIGTYTVTYTATDSSGNVATPVTRTVNVIAAPVVNTFSTGSSGGSTGGGSNTAPVTQTTTQSVTSTSTSTTTSSTGRVLGLETFQFNKNLRLGMTNNDVLELQKVLAKLGFFKVNPTGYFGQITLKAVKAYQASKGISPTGFVGVLTRAELNK